MTWAENMSEQNGESFAGITGEWDTVKLGGALLPGVCSVSAKIPESMDRRKGHGKKRSTPIDDGDKPMEFSVRLEILPEHFEVFRTETAPLLRSADKATGRAPLEFLHPMAELWGVSVVLIGSINVEAPKSGGTMVVSLELVEWVPAPAPVKTSSKPKGVRIGVPVTEATSKPTPLSGLAGLIAK